MASRYGKRGYITQNSLFGPYCLRKSYDALTIVCEAQNHLGAFHFSWCQTSEVSSRAFRRQKQLEIASKTVG